MKENIFFSEEEMAAAREYWLSLLSGDVNELDFPRDSSVRVRVTPGEQNKKENHKVTISKDVSGKLLGICKNQDLLLYIISVALFKVLLFKYTGQDDIVIASPIYTTTDDYYDYNRCIPLIDALHHKMTFRELLGNVKKTIVGGYKNQHYSIEKVLTAAEVSNKHLNYDKVILLLENIHNPELIDELVNSPTNDMIISLVRAGDSLEVNILYNPLLFKSETIHCISESYLHIFEQALSNSDIKLGEIGLVTEEEKQRLLVEFNDTGVDDPEQLTSTLVEWFENQVEKNPDKVVLVVKDLEITYNQFNEKADGLVHPLREQGVTADSIVGMMAEYSAEMIIGIMGILKSGGAYLPIDAGYPGKRIHYMLTDAGVEVLLIQQQFTSRIRTDFKGNLVKFEDLDRYQTDGASPVKINSVNDLAYIIYTSGSMGKPRGVMIQRQSLANYAAWRIRYYGFTPADKTLQLISVSFDGFGANLYPPLLSGGTLILPDGGRYGDFKYINGLIEKTKVTHMSVVPIMYRACLENAGKNQLKSLRIVVLAGERTTVELLAQSHAKNKDVTLINEYGPTEGTIAVAAFLGVTADQPGIIGKPTANTRIYIVDRNNQLQPVGMPGELCISGTPLARGYCNRPELTAEKFIEQVTDAGDNKKFLRGSRGQFLQKAPPGRRRQKIYTTGDRARWLPDGNIEFLGRIDQQVKIRGFRVEPQEIETAIVETGLVKEIVITSGKDALSNNYLCAYFTPITSNQKIKIPEFREILLGMLPEYMIPSRFIQLEMMPLTHNGKLDRKALPAPETFADTGVEFIVPTSQIEKKLAEIWQQTLNLERIGINDNFFDLGGNSILLMQVNSEIEKLYPGSLTITDFFACPTIAKLTRLMEKKQQRSDPDIEIKAIPLPKEYFKNGSGSKASSDFKLRISGDLFKKMKWLSEKTGTETSQILLAVYLLLIAKMTQQQHVTVQTMCQGKNRIIPLALDLTDVYDFPGFFKLIEALQKESRGCCLEDIGKIKLKKQENAVIPFFYKGDRLTLANGFNLLDIYDIVLEVRGEDDHLSLVCEYGGHLEEEKIEEFLREYVKLIHFVMTQCLERNAETHQEYLAFSNGNEVTEEF